MVLLGIWRFVRSRCPDASGRVRTKEARSARRLRRAQDPHLCTLRRLGRAFGQQDEEVLPAPIEVDTATSRGSWTVASSPALRSWICLPATLCRSSSPRLDMCSLVPASTRPRPGTRKTSWTVMKRVYFVAFMVSDPESVSDIANQRRFVRSHRSLPRGGVALAVGQTSTKRLGLIPTRNRHIGSEPAIARDCLARVIATYSSRLRRSKSST